MNKSLCSKCENPADRLCLVCLSKICANHCKTENHGFMLLESDTRELNQAEKEFVDSIRNYQQINHVDFYSVFKRVATDEVVTYFAMKKSLLDLKPVLDKQVVQNFMIFAGKFMLDEDLIDLAALCQRIKN